MENKNTLFLSTLAAACGALRLNKEVYVAFESIEVIFYPM